ncbi:MAG: hypothetical protein F7C35_01460 [Desulfurococcales archaeon]|nr:hypothetical protein [Desulfurococcales archaeon]
MRLRVIASLGFGIDFIVRRLADLKDEQITKIVAVGLYTDGTSWRRVEQTYSILTAYLRSQGIDSSLERLDIKRGRLVAQAREVIAKTLAEAGKDEIIELHLTGGPRLLLAAFYTAALTLADEWAKRLRLSVYGEGFPGSLTVEMSKLVVLIGLDKTSRRILDFIRDGYNDINSLIVATSLPRSTLYKKVKDLEKLGLIVRVRRGEIRLHPGLESLL